MSDITYEQMLEALVEEAQLAAERADEARLRAMSARMEVERLQGAIAAIRALLPAAETVHGSFRYRSLSKAATAAFAQHLDAVRTAATVSPTETDDNDGDDNSDRKRLPSTEWAAEIVIDAGRPMSREEVQDEFARRHGIPAAWSDPIGSISVALKRATQKRMIVRTGRATYAPPEQATDIESEELAMAE